MARALSVRSLRIRNAGTPRRFASAKRHVRSAVSRRASLSTSATFVAFGARFRLVETVGVFFLRLARGWRGLFHQELDRVRFIHGVAATREGGPAVGNLFAVFLKGLIRELQESRTRRGTEHFFKRITAHLVVGAKFAV